LKLIIKSHVTTSQSLHLWFWEQEWKFCSIHHSPFWPHCPSYYTYSILLKYRMLGVKERCF